MFTPRAFAYTGSRACSASINAATPPSFCASAIMCSASVVFPEDSAPYISIILPLGTPPSPNAISRFILPVEMTFIFIFWFSPSFMIEPSPNSLCICFIAKSSTFALSLKALSSFSSTAFFFAILYSPYTFSFYFFPFYLSISLFIIFFFFIRAYTIKWILNFHPLSTIYYIKILMK